MNVFICCAHTISIETTKHHSGTTITINLQTIQLTWLHHLSFSSSNNSANMFAQPFAPGQREREPNRPIMSISIWMALSDYVFPRITQMWRLLSLSFSWMKWCQVIYSLMCSLHFETRFELTLILRHSIWIYFPRIIVFITTLHPNTKWGFTT